MSKQNTEWNRRYWWLWVLLATITMLWIYVDAMFLTGGSAAGSTLGVFIPAFIGGFYYNERLRSLGEQSMWTPMLHWEDPARPGPTVEQSNNETATGT